MKKLASSTKVGENVWYEFNYEYKQSIVSKFVADDTKSFALCCFENGDSIFVNEFVYTENEDINDEMISELIWEAKDALRYLCKDAEELTKNINLTLEKINKLERFK
jgi:hypothetical protein